VTRKLSVSLCVFVRHFSDGTSLRRGSATILSQDLPLHRGSAVLHRAESGLARTARGA
jgi:hypothetical protein